MMGKTHVAIGILSSLAIFQPTTISQCALAIAGGALGGVAADIDTVDNDYKHDALIGQLLSFGIAGIMIFLMFITTNKSEFYASLSKDKISICIGIIAYLILMIKGYLSNHRTFTHSFLAMLLFTIAIGIVNLNIIPFYLIGYFSHLCLDLLNKKDVPLLYPIKKGICFKLCYASKIANSFFMWLGTFGSIFMILSLLLSK